MRDGALFHIRVGARGKATDLTSAQTASALIAAARRYHELSHWWCELVLLMPDHLHAMLAFPSTTRMTVTVRNWKRGTKRFQNVPWQEGFFDHRLRNDTESNECWHYIRRNPVVKCLCADEAAWRWWWSAVTRNDLLDGDAA